MLREVCLAATRATHKQLPVRLTVQNTGMTLDPRLARRTHEDRPLGTADSEYRIDLERIAISPYFSRLSAVTQVLSQSDSTQMVHNRMTHSMKVASVAWTIAAGLNSRAEFVDTIAALGGCDPLVAQAGGWAHDIGHPPFGHSGEHALDRLAKDHFGLSEGFEGNAQTFRTLVELDVNDAASTGLNLTAAVRASVLKYPWARRVVRPTSDFPLGARPGADGFGPAKLSAYVLNVPELESVRSAYPTLAPWKQTLECSVMDLADDITYSLHDLDDFYRVGVLSYADVEREFGGWLSTRGADGGPGAGLEALRLKIQRDDSWIADDDRFELAVQRVRDDLVEGVLTVPFDGSLAAQRNLSSFVSTWLSHLQQSVVVTDDPPARSGYVRLEPQAWHEIRILKFVHQHFVLRRPELGLYRSGQEFVLTTIVRTLDLWLQDRTAGPRVPARLLDLIELARHGYDRTLRDRPELLEGQTSRADLDRMSRARGIFDYVASLTDAQAQTMARTITGHPVLNWGSI